MIAATNGYTDCLKLLLNAGADMSLRSKKQKTALDMCKNQVSLVDTFHNCRGMSRYLEGQVCRVRGEITEGSRGIVLYYT
jgi:hypothetical protein